MRVTQEYDVLYRYKLNLYESIRCISSILIAHDRYDYLSDNNRTYQTNLGL